MPVILTKEQTANIEQAQRKVDMADAILLLEPEEAPFTVLLRKLMKKKAINPEFKWLEDEMVPHVDQVNNGAGYTAGDTSIVVDNGAYFAIGDLVKVFKTGEVLRVTNVVTNTLTVTRSWGATAAGALADNDVLFILGPAIAEAADVGAARMTKKVPVTNYTEIFRHPVKLSKTLQASGLYGVNDNERAYLRRKAGIEHNRAIERAFWFGEKNEDTSGDPIRSTGGVEEFIVTNVTTLANDAAMTNAALDAFLETVFLYGSNERWGFVSPHMLSLINAFAQSKIQIQQLELGRAGDATYGIRISRYQSPHGVVNLVNTRMFKDFRSLTGAVAGKVGFFIDIDDDAAAYRWLRQTELSTDIQTPGQDAFLDEYLTECGLQLGREKAHGQLVING